MDLRPSRSGKSSSVTGWSSSTIVSSDQSTSVGMAPSYCLRTVSSRRVATTRYHILPSLGKARETARNSEPTATESDRRFRHPIYAGLLMNLWRDTGRTPYRDAAWTTIASPADARREIDA